MMKQLVLASIPAQSFLTLLILPSLVAPLILACAFIVTSFSECETSLSDTTSTVNILSLVLRSSHFLCCKNLLEQNTWVPSEGDICPSRPRFVRLRELTRLGFLTEHRTPSQLQKWVLTFQDIKACCGS